MHNKESNVRLTKCLLRCKLVTRYHVSHGSERRPEDAAPAGSPGPVPAGGDGRGACLWLRNDKAPRARGLSIVGEGSIYPLLGRLERDGLVNTHRAASNGGPPRKYYQLSGQGERALASGITEWRTTRDAVDSVLGHATAEVTL